jgi:hypothetical protein
VEAAVEHAMIDCMQEGQLRRMRGGTHTPDLGRPRLAADCRQKRNTCRTACSIKSVHVRTHKNHQRREVGISSMCLLSYLRPTLHASQVTKHLTPAAPAPACDQFVPICTFLAGANATYQDIPAGILRPAFARQAMHASPSPDPVEPSLWHTLHFDDAASCHPHVPLQAAALASVETTSRVCCAMDSSSSVGITST